jgi:23S rRNA (adenine-N6)-dimethyltransferase
VGEKRPPTSALGRHSVSPRLAAELVRSFRIQPDETVVEVGAGSGRITRELAKAARLVVALELDLASAQRLLRGDPPPSNLLVHRGDALAAVLPPVPFRLVGNIPFGISTGLLRRFLDDEGTTGIELIVQLEFARKVASARGHVLPLLWATAWKLELRERISSRRFHPAPSVDAAWLSGARRDPPLIRSGDLPAFERLVRRAFHRADLAVGRSLDLSPSVLHRVGRTGDRAAGELDVAAWVDLFEAIRASGRAGGGPRRNL